MAAYPSVSLTPRRTPRQARSAVTLDAIFEATIQVLLLDGPARLTTTRIADRAGVSVGTLYQYLHNKQALLYAMTERYFGVMAASMEQACLERHGTPISRMAETLVEAFWHATTTQCQATHAVYLVAAEMDSSALMEAFSKRIERATAAMFVGVPDAEFADLSLVNYTLLNSLFSTVRNLFDRNLPKP